MEHENNGCTVSKISQQSTWNQPSGSKQMKYIEDSVFLWNAKVMLSIHSKMTAMFYYQRNETMFLNVEHGKYNYWQIIIWMTMEYDTNKLKKIHFTVYIHSPAILHFVLLYCSLNCWFRSSLTLISWNILASLFT